MIAEWLIGLPWVSIPAVPSVGFFAAGPGRQNVMGPDNSFGSMLANAKETASSALIAAPSAPSSRRRSSPSAAVTRSPVSRNATRRKFAFGSTGDACGEELSALGLASLNAAYAAPRRTPATSGCSSAKPRAHPARFVAPCTGAVAHLSSFIERHRGVELVGHSGNQNGFISHFYIHRPSKSGYIVAFNTDVSSRRDPRHTTRAVDGDVRDAISRGFCATAR